MSTAKKDSDKDATSINVAWEDQEKINHFARHNLQAQEIKVELKEKQKELTDLEFAEEELMMLDDSDTVSFRIGSVFVSKPADTALHDVQRKKNEVESSQTSLRSKLDSLNEEMQKLRVALYAKFGKSINLEPDNDDDDDDNDTN